MKDAAYDKQLIEEIEKNAKNQQMSTNLKEERRNCKKRKNNSLLHFSFELKTEQRKNERELKLMQNIPLQRTMNF